MKYSIYMKSNVYNGLTWVKTIYQHVFEENIPYRRRAKRELKKITEKNPERKFYLIDEDE